MKRLRPSAFAVRLLSAVLCAMGAIAGLPSSVRADAPPQKLSLDEAIRLAFSRNRDVIAAKLGVSAAEVERVGAGLLPNPEFSYELNNFNVGPGTVNCPTCGPEGVVSNTVHSVQLSWELDIWGKRNLRIDVARFGIDVARTQLKDALRSIGYAVTGAYLKVQHADESMALAIDIQQKYGETVRVSRERTMKGDLSGNELAKIELEMLRYEAALLSARQELELDQRVLKELLAMPPSTPDFAIDRTEVPRKLALEAQKLDEEAMEGRADYQALLLVRKQAERSVALARLVVVPNPDINVGYTHSFNTIAGDNADTLSTGIAFALPIFDRNQADIGRANVAVQRADNDIERMKLTVVHDVAEAMIRVASTQAVVDSYERREPDAYGKLGNRLERSDELLRTATTAHQIGATSLLELLEAQRTYNSTRSDYIDALETYREALAQLSNALGKNGIYTGGQK